MSENVFERRAERDLVGTIRAFLEEQGVDVDRELEAVDRSVREDARQTRAARDGLISLAGAVVRAKRQVEVDEALWRMQGRRNDSFLRDLTASMEHADELAEALREACCHDDGLYAVVMRKARARR